MRKQIRKLQRIASKAIGRYRHAQATVRNERKALRSYRELHSAAAEAQDIIQKLAAEVQTTAHQQITTVVTRSLQIVFGKPYQFEIQFHRKRGRTEARLKYRLNGHEIDPVTEDGGGLLDISAFALRLSCLRLITPQRRRVLLLDEPFRNVNGEEYQERTLELIQSLSKSFGVQIIYATGLSWLKAGKVHEI